MHPGRWNFPGTGTVILFPGDLRTVNSEDGKKIVEDGSCFRAPKAYLSVSRKSLWDACQKLTGLFHKYADRQPLLEQKLPILYNEWCMSWGDPREDTILLLAERLKETPAAYLVIDAGWSRQPEGVKDPQEGNGDWEYEERQFPQGIAVFIKKIKRQWPAHGHLDGI